MRKLIFFLIVISNYAFADGPSYERVLTCDGGAAYLEVVTYERKFLQLVITNPRITKYLTESSFVKPVWDNPNVLVISGASSNGVFSKGDFSSMEIRGSDIPGYINVAHVDREFDGLYVHFEMLDQHSGYGANYTYPGNWHFQHCQ